MNDKATKMGNPEPLTPELEAELAALAAMPDELIDFSDIPDVRDWSGAVCGKFFGRGKSRP